MTSRDILGIIDISGNIVAQYDYTAYGTTKVTLNTNGIGTLNPFRYKGYYYDSESGLYYCQSRYYVSIWGRWLNADKQDLQPLSLIKANPFVFCNNSPINTASVFVQQTINLWDATETITVPVTGESNSSYICDLTIANVIDKIHTTIDLINASDWFKKYMFDISLTWSKIKENKKKGLFYKSTDVGIGNCQSEVNNSVGISPGKFGGLEIGVNNKRNLFVIYQLSPFLHLGVQGGLDGFGLIVGVDFPNGESLDLTLRLGQLGIIVAKVVIAAVVFLPDILGAIAAIIIALLQSGMVPVGN